MILYNNSDQFLERRNIKKKLLAWRLVVIIMILYIILIKNHHNGFTDSKDYIARVKIDKEILYDVEKINKLSYIKHKSDIKALILHINSPGGTVGGSEAIYHTLKKVSEKIPIAVVMGDIATSGGYMISLAGSRIFCMKGTLTGSIGVITQNFEVTELAKKLGIGINIIKSSELKAAPSMFEKASTNVVKDMQGKVDSIAVMFADLVKKERKLSDDEIKLVANGAVIIGQDALKLKLIDEIGTEEDAINWLKSKGIDYEVADYHIEDTENKLMSYIEGFGERIMSFIKIKILSM